MIHLQQMIERIKNYLFLYFWSRFHRIGNTIRHFRSITFFVVFFFSSESIDQSELSFISIVPISDFLPKTSIIMHYFLCFFKVQLTKLFMYNVVVGSGNKYKSSQAVICGGVMWFLWKLSTVTLSYGRVSVHD